MKPTTKTLLEETYVSWNDNGEGVDIGKTSKDKYFLHFPRQPEFSSIKLDILEEAQEFAQKLTEVFRSAEKLKPEDMCMFDEHSENLTLNAII